MPETTPENIQIQTYNMIRDGFLYLGFGLFFLMAFLAPISLYAIREMMK